MKPSDIFIGVIDFFSVLLPGALLTYFLAGFYGADVFGEQTIFLLPTSEAAKWAIFLVVSYIVGNLIFMLASLLDLTYDKDWFCSKYDLSYKTATRIREKHFDRKNILRELFYAGKFDEYAEFSGKSKPEIVNTFKWAQHFLLFNKPEALADVQRIVADSKFFRSLVVAFAIIAVLLFVKLKILFGIVFVVLAILCYYRYGELRFKSTEKAYELVITFFYLKPEEKRAADEPKKEEKSAEKSEEAEKIEKSEKEQKDEIISRETVQKTDEEPAAISGLKQNLSENYAVEHREIISFLTKGIAKPLKRLSFEQNDQSRSFVSDRNETWYCLRGRGILKRGGGETETIYLMPNEIISVRKDGEISFAGDESVEILVLED